MVIVNPKLSLQANLPYKTRQRPFNPNTSLHQATIRYNEALRKQYNDIQFAKRYENGIISQNELTSVNTIDIAKLVDPQFFSEMSDLNPLFSEAQQNAHGTRKRKSKKIFICSGSSISDAITGSGGGGGSGISGSSYDHQASHVPSNGLASPTSGSGIVTMTSNNHNEDNGGSGLQGTNNGNATYDCNNTEMFPQLQATMPSTQTENEKTFFSRSNNGNRQQQQHPPQVQIQSQPQPPPPSSNSSLEAQAINEYEPTADSAHDMIFGNVMGLHYGNFIHDHLWTPNNQHQQQQQNQNVNNNEPACQFPPEYQQISLSPPSSPHNHSPQQPQQNQINKTVGFNLPAASGSCQNQSQQNGYLNMNYNNNNLMLANASNSATGVPGGSPMTLSGNCFTHIHTGNGSSRPSSRSRSTSVPRPRVGGARKETLKQAAIRCGIIKGNQTVPVIPKRSLCLSPLQLSAAQSDPAVSVVEILHGPRTLIPTCSSELLVDENYAYNRFKLSLNPQNQNGDGYVPTTATTTSANEPGSSSVLPTPRENISEEGRLLTQISSISDFRILEGAMSCASF